MDLFVSVILLAVGGILAGIAATIWAKGGYNNARLALWWGVVAYIVLGVGVLVTYYSYVIKPARAAERTPMGESSILGLPSIPHPTTERPELFVEQVEIKPFQIGKPETVSLIFRNKGKVTAQNVTIETTHAHHPKGFDGPLVYETKPPESKPTIGPDAVMTTISRSPWLTTASHIQEITTGSRMLFVYGKGHYEDQMGRQYPINFCFLYDPSLPRNMVLCPTRYLPSDKSASPIVVPSVTPEQQGLSLADRPYVVVESAYIPNLIPNKPISPVITIVNKGRTPAQRLAMSLEIAAKPGFIYWLGFGQEVVRGRPVQVAFLAAGDKVTVGGAPADEVTLDSKFFDDAMAGKESLMIYGMGEYEDMAGGEYEIEYSFGYHPSAKGFVADFGGPNRYEKWMDEREKKKKGKNPN